MLDLSESKFHIVDPCLDRVVTESRKSPYGSDSYAKMAYRAGLAAVPDCAEEVRRLAREVVGRGRPEHASENSREERQEEPIPDRLVEFELITGERIVDFQGWPAGPGTPLPA